MAKDIKPTDLQIQLAFDEMIADYHLYSEEKPYAIVVAGVSGSGKSTCIANLLEKISLNYFPIQA
ncbi:antitoxin/toxin system zeta toxin, signal recognition particle GTPase, partial [Glaesserella parasuis]|nr:antitoxin/toxin system zeta toxin, signal recognition particle GTPase [Glaesserella parasuis]MCT8601480.1 antitoxin/toxin system zeta toxin, signal recognition particle GTPase [Glaesserella parasuis]MCT8690975.1 antitoxin/toxin system zeta toxin, signal recognition particle GTPase [Glaesserella parasuis]MDE3968975.1 antitoxin/toxin system zeta toxin, signal recognition particle GTPase [Glaesserella parasuis]MDE3971420.1 antitoxin/toxin system zeta toxin, signal recognition particle GTPase [G